MISIADKADCCGCTACASICGKHCIHMEPDEEGFLYPAIDKDLCIDCGACNAVCPVMNAKEEKPFSQKAYIVNNKNETERKESTSGGAFTPIAKYIIENGGVVFGAAFDDQMRVIHTYADNANDLWKFRGSKYVQSDMDGCFLLAKEYLDSGKPVCYSGTPCQIEGLKQYLRKEYENLITVDLVCRSVPSPLVWNRYLSYIKEHMKSSHIASVSFRDKSKYGYQYPNIRVSGANGTYYNGVESDPYLRSFFENISIRPSCYQCGFKKRYRVSDFTIWDCFFAEKFALELDDNKGTTCVLIHSQKGMDLFRHIIDGFHYKEVHPDDIVKGMNEMFKSVPTNNKREAFFKDISVLNETELFNKHFPNTIKTAAAHYTKVLLSKTNLYKKVKRQVKKKS